MSARAARAAGLVLSALLFAIGSASSARAQAAYPDRPVHVVVPFPPGSALDMITRLVSDRLSQKWGQPVVVENLSGGSGNMGASHVSRSDPDGYTLLATPPGPIVLNKALYKDTNYDATKFVPLSVLATVPNVLVVRNALPKTFKEFLAYAHANPGKLNYASQGVGSTGFLTARQLELKAGIEMVHVPYRGAAPILSDIAGGQVDLFFDTATTSLPLHQNGMARILAVADDTRAPALPDVPTVAELVPGFRSITWFGLAAPEGTPKTIADKISGDVAAIIASPEISERLRSLQMTPRGTSVEETRRFFDEERANWTKLINDIGLEPQ